MTAIILAAGFSRRFGKEKLLMNIKGKPIVLHVIDLVLGMNFNENVLVFQNDEIGKLAEDKNIKCIYNPAAIEGISASIKCGIQNSDNADAYIFFLGDQPFIDSFTVNQLLKAYYEGKGSIIVPKYEGTNGNPVIFAAAWKEQLEGLCGDVGGKTIIKENPEKVFFIDAACRKAGNDIDTWEDYEGNVL
jgi:molybdenum cofactor cytidylyltransferase